MSAGFSHGVVPVWSHPGAAPGGLNRLTLLRGGRAEPQPTFVSGLTLEAGDEVVIETASGGNA